MKQLAEALKGARKIEILIIAVMLCALLVMGMNGGEPSSASDPEAEQLERILSRIEGAGNVSAMLSKNKDDVLGCVVVSAGADDIRVMLELQRAVRALTGLELDRIEIVKSKR